MIVVVNMVYSLTNPLSLIECSDACSDIVSSVDMGEDTILILVKAVLLFSEPTVLNRSQNLIFRFSCAFYDTDMRA